MYKLSSSFLTTDRFGLFKPKFFAESGPGIYLAAMAPLIRLRPFLTGLLFLASFSLHAGGTNEPSGSTKKKTPYLHHATLTMGYGVPSIIRAWLRSNTSRDQIRVRGYGPLILKGEYFLNKRFSLGLNATYSRSRVSWMDYGYDTIQQKYHLFEFGIKAYEISGNLRANYHFWKRRHIDSYAGLGLGFGYIKMWTYTYAHTTKFDMHYNVPRPINLECTWGFRYFPIKNLGVYTEVGIGKSWLLFNKYFVPEALIQSGLILAF